MVNIIRQHAKGWHTLSLLGTALVMGSWGIATPAIAAPATSSVFTEADASKMKDMESKIETLQSQLNQMAGGLASHSDSNEGLPMHGFMDVGFAGNTVGDPVAYPKGFFVGALSFYLTPHFGDRVKALVEPNFEVTPEGTVATDLERLQIGYTFSDTATLWAGRFHTPYGYWNTAFHHGAQIQTAVNRPRFLDFEDKGGILPAHMVGLWGTGKIKMGGNKFTYDVYAGNGPKIVMGPVDPYATLAYSQTAGTLDINLAGDNNHQAMVGFNLGYEFQGSLDGLRLSIHGLRGDVDDDSSTYISPTTPPTPIYNKTTLNMYGGALVYLTDEWEVMGEIYQFSNKDKSTNTGSHKSRASVLQVGRSFNNLVPYVRLEKTALDQKDSYFGMQASGQSYTRQALGLRYNVNTKTALKLELLNTHFEQESNRPVALHFRSLFVQYAIGF